MATDTFFVANLTGWCRTFYCAWRHADQGADHGLNMLGTLSMRIVACYRETARKLCMERCTDDLVCRRIDEIRADMKRRGRTDGDVYKCADAHMDRWVEMGMRAIMKDVSGIRKLYAAMLAEIARKKDEKKRRPAQ